ncbi:MAG: TetR/AcrR family transcriptional regulator [Phenylobacterium sp.]|uniref:TetR/AcrR family transcriptional regulator n=1 Tax=Phenylobacterium sp. TaxID=1871053 RepID=UPI001B562DDB|nr:TetR/AcrR family transcriptional regulator [Phenylobacterium sp.]MBP7817614.1 TetR/AcrR family transcriptional regulator [Phenylobacterium sp.]MBP9232218.1 TetR/AcrR family transcriptional regulator [Phenylobacterium sp.]
MVQIAPRPRGRPRSYDPQVALDQARAAFWNTGYAATSLDDLSAATGLNRPSLYGAFGDKKALYILALEKTRAEIGSSLAQAFAPEDHLRTALTRVYEATAAVYMRGDAGPRGCFLIGTAVTEAVDDPDVRAVLGLALSEIDAAFEARIRRAMEVGNLPGSSDAAGMARVATGVLNGMAVRARAGGDLATLRAMGASAVDLICGRAGR